MCAMNRSRCLLFSVGRLLASAAALTVLLTAGRPVFAQTPIRIMFLHHSTGHNLIEQGGVREGLTALGYEFYDHGYNGDGLRLADGEYTGTNFDVPGDNTDPDGLAETFSQPLHDPPDNAFSQLMQYDVIIIKSCFPTSNIADDQQLADDQSYYLTIRDRMSELPGKLLIIVTQPPQVPANTNPEEGERARILASWLASDEFLAGIPMSGRSISSTGWRGTITFCDRNIAQKTSMMRIPMSWRTRPSAQNSSPLSTRRFAATAGWNRAAGLS
jgi:hypothetical protein